MSRAVRSKRYKYIRNYFPHLSWARRLDYLWKMPTMRSWEEEYKNGRLNPVQARFFGEKPTEELYDLTADPYEVNNLAGDPACQETLLRLRAVNRDFLLAVRDLGFLPEAEMISRAAGGAPFDLGRDPARYDLPRILPTAEAAGERNPKNVGLFVSQLSYPDSAVRYWAAVGLAAAGADAEAAAESLRRALSDSSPSVRIAAASALCRLGEREAVLQALEQELDGPDPWAALQAADAAADCGLADHPRLRQKSRRAVRKVQAGIARHALR